MLRRIFSLLNVQWSGDYYHLCLFGLLYYVAVIIGLESRVEAVALFWPANGVAFGFFLIKPSKQWLHYICVMSLGYIIGMYATGDYSWTIMFGALAANIIQTVSGTALVRYFLPGKITFTTVKEIITILFLTSIAGSMISACFSVSILGAGFMKTPFELWASGVIDNAGSTIMALPLVLLLLTSSNFSFKNIIEYSNTYKTIEFLVLIITTFLLTEYVFSLEASTTSLTRTLPYLLLPCVLWSALRFSGITVALLVLFVGTEAVRHTVIGQGPFSDTYSGFILVLTLHLYISVTMITGLLFSALIKQQQMTMYSLAGSIAHEVRTPLSQVLYQLYKLEQSYEERVSHSNVEKKEKWQDTKNTVLHGLQVIDMILNETKGNLISLGNLEYISAKDATLSAVENYAYRNQYERSRVQVSVDKDFTLKIERMLFDHIVFNLLKNALYYISHYPEANIAVTVRGDVHYNTIEVQDTGPGIEKEKIPMLFNEFYSDKKSGGTGLGLSYCKRTMKAFGGDILCDSVKEEYTKFTLIFPKTKRNAEPSEVGKLKVCSESESCNGLAGKTILYVDDEEINHMILNEAFENMNVEILNFFSVDDAMKALAKVECHAIIADLNMPYKSGIDLVREIRSNRKLGLQSIPVIGLGGDPSFIATRACLDAGMNVYLHKPLNKTKLMEALCYHLNPELAKEKQLKAAEEEDQAIKSMGVNQRELYDAGARLMHDIATPIATIKMCYEPLKEYVDNLVGFYHSRDNMGNSCPSKDTVEWFSSVPLMYRDLAQSSRKYADNFWRNFSDTTYAAQEQLFVEFTTDISKNWSLLEKYKPSIQSDLDELTAFYKNNAGDVQPISDQELAKLADIMKMCMNAVSRVNEKLSMIREEHDIN